MLFGPKLPITTDEFDWLCACMAWLSRTIGERDARDGVVPELVLPNSPYIAGATTAASLFDGVKILAGLEQWHCVLEQGDPARPELDLGIGSGLQTSSYALGTFSVDGNTPVIRYDPNLLRNPDALVATYAHELAHLLIHDLGDPPGGEALHEHATDCLAVYLGFGVFLANSARHFEQFQEAGMMGWRSQASGYLSEQALVTLLAMFERLFPAKQSGVSHLKPYLQSDFAKAARYLDRKHPDLAGHLTSIDLAEYL